MTRSPHFLTLWPDSRKLLEHKLHLSFKDCRTESKMTATGQADPSQDDYFQFPHLQEIWRSLLGEKGTWEKEKCFSEIPKKEKAAPKMWLGMSERVSQLEAALVSSCEWSLS